MQTGQTRTVTYVPVAFSDDEFDMLVKKVGSALGPDLAEYIYNIVMRSLKRKTRKVKEDIQP